MLQKYQFFWNYYVDIILIITGKYKIRFELEIEITKLNVHLDSSLEDTYHSIGEGDGTPLQYFWLENPMDGGAW